MLLIICAYAWIFVSVWFNLDIQREEKNVQKAIKEAAKRNDMGSAKVFLSFMLRLVILFFCCWSIRVSASESFL